MERYVLLLQKIMLVNILRESQFMYIKLRNLIGLNILESIKESVSG